MINQISTIKMVVFGLCFIVMLQIGYAIAGQESQNSQIMEPLPNMTFIQATVDDSGAGGNNNQILEPGETAKIRVQVFNMGTATAWGLHGDLSTTVANVTVTDDTAFFGDILPKQIVQTQAPHFTVTVGSTVPCGTTLKFTLILSGTNYDKSLVFSLPMRNIPSQDMAAFNEDAIMYGADAGDYAGSSVASGDINGDGYKDLIIGVTHGSGPANGRTSAGEVWIIYGSAANGFPSTVDLSAPPSNSSVIYGVNVSDQAGWSVASGDINGDGYDDLIIGAPYSDGPGNARNGSGEVWVLYGSAAGLGASIDLANPPANASVIYGADASDNAGESVGSGDINGDGYNDLIIGALNSYGPGNTRYFAGEVWIIYGSSDALGASIDLSAPPANASVIYGADVEDNAGDSVSSGDINDDGYDDLIIGAPYSDGIGNAHHFAGEVWVIYGSSDGIIDSIDLANPPTNSSVIYGANANDEAGNSVASGDINGDGYDDLILGAFDSDGPDNIREDAGEVWVIYSSSAGLGTSIDLAAPPPNSSVIYGADAGDYAGLGVASGDINGDGYDDVIAGVGSASGPGNTRANAGEVWIIFGETAGPGASIDLANPPANASVIYGADVNDYAGYCVASGDINGDGYDDVIVGARYSAGPDNTRNGAGEAGLFFGKPFDYYYNKSDTYSFIDATTGTNINLACNKCCKMVSIGFTFSFYQENYNYIRICDDGYVSFSPVPLPTSLNLCMPNKTAPNNIIAAFWDDLNLRLCQKFHEKYERT